MQLMNYEEYEKSKHEVPYLLKLKYKGKYLYYFGERHSYDPKNKQWEKLKEFWEDFLKETQDQKRIAFIEGGNPPAANTEDEAVVNYGGGGLITYLAKKSSIPTFSPEPNEKFEREELVKRFPKDVIQYYYFARVVHQWGLLEDPKPNFEEYITRYLNADKRESGWIDFDFSLNNMREIHKKLFNSEFDENDQDFIGSVSNPVSQETEVNKVSRASSEIRDIHIVETIRQYLEQGYSIFAIYGYSHVVMQEPVLKSLNL